MSKYEITVKKMSYSTIESLPDLATSTIQKMADEAAFSDINKLSYPVKYS